MPGKTLQVGDTIRVRLSTGEEVDRILEDGPYIDKDTWITVADDAGEISSAIWDNYDLIWKE